MGLRPAAKGYVRRLVLRVSKASGSVAIQGRDLLTEDQRWQVSRALSPFYERDLSDENIDQMDEVLARLDAQFQAEEGNLPPPEGQWAMIDRGAVTRPPVIILQDPPDQMVVGTTPEDIAVKRKEKEDWDRKLEAAAKIVLDPPKPAALLPADEVESTDWLDIPPSPPVETRPIREERRAAPYLTIFQFAQLLTRASQEFQRVANELRREDPSLEPRDVIRQAFYKMHLAYGGGEIPGASDAASSELAGPAVRLRRISWE